MKDSAEKGNCTLGKQLEVGYYGLHATDTLSYSHKVKSTTESSLLVVVVPYSLPNLISASVDLCFSDCNIPHSPVTTIPTAGHFYCFHWMLKFLQDTNTSARYHYCFSIYLIHLSLTAYAQ